MNLIEYEEQIRNAEGRHLVAAVEYLIAEQHARENPSHPAHGRPPQVEARDGLLVCRVTRYAAADERDEGTTQYRVTLCRHDPFGSDPGERRYSIAADTRGEIVDAVWEMTSRPAAERALTLAEMEHGIERANRFVAAEMWLPVVDE